MPRPHPFCVDSRFRVYVEYLLLEHVIQKGVDSQRDSRCHGHECFHVALERAVRRVALRLAAKSAYEIRERSKVVCSSVSCCVAS